jgi:hypothetical protein
MYKKISFLKDYQKEALLKFETDIEFYHLFGGAAIESCHNCFDFLFKQTIPEVT